MNCEDELTRSEMADDFVNNQMSVEVLRAYIAHFNRCDECRHEVIVASAFKDALLAIEQLEQRAVPSAVVVWCDGGGTEGETIKQGGAVEDGGIMMY